VTLLTFLAAGAVVVAPECVRNVSRSNYNQKVSGCRPIKSFPSPSPTKTVARHSNPGLVSSNRAHVIPPESRRNPARCISSAQLVQPSPSNAGRFIILIDSDQLMAAPSALIQSLPVALFASNQLITKRWIAVASAIIPLLLHVPHQLNSSRHFLTNRIEMNAIRQPIRSSTEHLPSAT
jgi:hypothetical protein